MNIAIVGSGRAAGAIALTAFRRGHTITSIEGRNLDAVADLGTLLDVSPGIPDLCILAVSDTAIPEVASSIADRARPVQTVHVSGAVPVDALAPVAATGVQTGSMHPLQTLPDARRGAARLEGSWMAITAEDPLRGTLGGLAVSMGCRPFDLSDDVKPLYHAAAAAAANYTLTTLDLAMELFEAAGVPFEAARPLLDAIIANAFDLGPAAALTGPVARGDVATVASQLAAIRDRVPQAEELFVDLTRATARLAGTSDEIERIIT